METIKLHSEEEKEIVGAVENIILKRHPIIKNRTNTLLHAPGPKMEISITVYEEQKNLLTQILFCDGNTNAIVSIPDRICIDGLITKQTVVQLIRFLIADHDWVQYISNNGHEISMPFRVNLCDASLGGIDCSELALNVDFHYCENREILCQEYYSEIIANFYNQLSHIKNLPKVEEAITKESILASLSKAQMQALIDRMEEKEIRQLLEKLPEDQFFKYYDDSPKKLTR